MSARQNHPDPFVYADEVASVGVKQAHVAVIPPGIRGKAALFRCLIQQLDLPEHFGANWDALDECLRDLSWIEQRRVVLFHEALPDLEPRDLTTYLEILRDAIVDWRRDLDDELLVALPFSERARVAALPALER